ncbi:MAG: MBL fold metallo-hydrolase [Sciscionella sp.]
MAHPAYGVLRPVTPFASVLLDENPGMMTLDGTNSWLLRAPGSAGCVLVDPGYLHEEHLNRLAAHGPVELVLLTHRHPDHAESAESFAERVGAAVRAFDAQRCVGAQALTDDEVVDAAGLRLRVLHTPGHTDDSICLRVAVGAAESEAVLTGDTILGRGTTVISALGPYLDSLRRLAELPAGTVGLPGHGPELADMAGTVLEYREHRERRLDQVRMAVRELGEQASVLEVVERVYVDVDPSLLAPAESSVRAQLEYLREHG